MKFRTPQVNIYVESLDVSRRFYERIGFNVKFTAEIGVKPVHHEMVLDGSTLGIATKDSAKEDHGLEPGKNSGCEIVLWTENTDESLKFL